MFLDEIFSGSSERHCTAESKSSAAIDENVVIGMAEMAFTFRERISIIGRIFPSAFVEQPAEPFR
jgi:hypothetical protein